jgi:putative flippase GtrA
MKKVAEVARIYRYAAAGMLNTLAAYAVFAAILFSGVHYAVATLVGGFAGVVTSYWLSSRWVFGYTGRQRYGRFLMLFAFLYGSNVAIQKTIMTWITADGYLAGAIGTVVTAAVGYFAGREWIFVDEHSANRTARSSL